MNPLMNDRDDGPRIAPSVLSADFSRLAEQIRAVERGGADCLHLDVMDGHFVPNLTFGPMIVEAIRRLTELPLHTHLMIEEPHRYLEQFVQAGSDSVTVHVELYDDPVPVLSRIRDLGVRAGLTLNPDTPFERVEPVLSAVDLLLVMSVNPGFGGQRFRPEVLGKVTRAVDVRAREGLSFDIHIDGGIDETTAPAAARAGVDVLVAGSAVFTAPDPGAMVATLRRVARAARNDGR